MSVLPNGKLFFTGFSLVDIVHQTFLLRYRAIWTLSFENTVSKERNLNLCV